MIRRLVEANYHAFAANPTDAQRDFWLLEARTPAILIALAADDRFRAEFLLARRPLLADVLASDFEKVAVELDAEKRQERLRDTAYWKPLQEELEHLGHSR